MRTNKEFTNLIFQGQKKKVRIKTLRVKNSARNFNKPKGKDNVPYQRKPHSSKSHLRERKENEVDKVNREKRTKSNPQSVEMRGRQ